MFHEILYNIIHYVQSNPLRNDNDIVEHLSRTYLENNPTKPYYNSDNLEKNDMQKPEIGNSLVDGNSRVIVGLIN